MIVLYILMFLGFLYVAVDVADIIPWNKKEKRQVRVVVVILVSTLAFVGWLFLNLGR